MVSGRLETRAPDSISVSASALIHFEPQGLGPVHARWRRLLQEINGRPQSVIGAILDTEAASSFSPGQSGQPELAYQVAVLVLRDYMNSGYYPLVHRGACMLAPVFESSALTPEKKRRALQMTYASARNRALRDRGQPQWMPETVFALTQGRYNPGQVLEALRSGPPEVALDPATASRRATDARGLWRAVRATWSMGPEMSAPGREVALLLRDARYPDVPLGIAQFRNVVPEIAARDAWLGIVSGSRDGGLIRILATDQASIKDRLSLIGNQMRLLLSSVDASAIDAVRGDEIDLDRLVAFMRGAQSRHAAMKKAGNSDAQSCMAHVKQAETLWELSRGLHALATLLQNADPLAVLCVDGQLRRDLDAGLRKLWHYHMGFVAVEMSICGAAPPFGPARLGKLMAGLAGSQETVGLWGDDRPLGQIASWVYKPEVREVVPNPGPLVVFTSGLYPGHSAQYNRVSSGSTRWAKIGETTGYGSFHIGVDTTRAIESFNNTVDGYARITRAFGEGSGARFRSVGRALGRLGLPDLRRHETRRPLYALPLVDSPAAVILGWEKGTRKGLLSAQQIADNWWHRWFQGNGAALIARAQKTPDLVESLKTIVEATRD